MEFIKVKVEPVHSSGAPLPGVEGAQRTVLVPISKVSAFEKTPGGGVTAKFERGFLESLGYKFITLDTKISDDFFKRFDKL